MLGAFVQDSKGVFMEARLRPVAEGTALLYILPGDLDMVADVSACKLPCCRPHAEGA